MHALARPYHVRKRGLCSELFPVRSLERHRRCPGPEGEGKSGIHRTSKEEIAAAFAFKKDPQALALFD